MIQNTGRCGCMPFPRVLTRNMQPHPEHKHSLLIQVSMPATITPRKHKERIHTDERKKTIVCMCCVYMSLYVCMYVFCGTFCEYMQICVYVYERESTPEYAMGITATSKVNFTEIFCDVDRMSAVINLRNRRLSEENNLGRCFQGVIQCAIGFIVFFIQLLFIHLLFLSSWPFQSLPDKYQESEKGKK